MTPTATELTCIVCPNGCSLQVQQDPNDAALHVTGAACPRGVEYARQETTDPRRNIATSVLVHGGVLPLASVRLTSPVPKADIFEVVRQIHAITLQAPVAMGQVVIENVCGLHADVIVTRAVAKK